MNEADWLSSTNPRAVLLRLRDSASDRKLRLLACACCRTVCRELGRIHVRGCYVVDFLLQKG
ncbi:MAG TPA: hypothetical protein VEL76_04520 [Gemmataceae bacterium]|nr:hypothetical protein [Gemmataceae bacterium]